MSTRASLSDGDRVDVRGIRVAVVGAGAWGGNHVRAFGRLGPGVLAAVCDPEPKHLAAAAAAVPGIRCTSGLKDLLENGDGVEAVVVSTPSSTHFEVALAALMAGKHVLVEKPLALIAAQAERLVREAASRHLVLMTGHLLLYHPAVRRMKELVDSGELGSVYYLYSQRVNLGQVRRDENALWSLAPHDIAVTLYLLGEEPVDVSARGGSYLQDGIPDVVFLNMRFAGDRMAQVQLSWLDPHKIRRTTVVGSRKMVVFDDMDSLEKLRIYDKGVDRNPGAVPYSDSLTLRWGDVLIPRIKMEEPLVVECRHFLQCIRDGALPLSDGRQGLAVVRILEAAQASMERGGEPVALVAAGEAR